MKENLNVLDELNKGCCMGIDALNFIIEKVEEKEFSNLLQDYKKHYEEISKRIEKLYQKNSSKEPHETSKMTKAMTWYGIQMNTMMDKSTSKLAELLLQGTNMGIIEGRKLLNTKDIDKETNDILNTFINAQEKFCESLKKYL